MALVLAGLALPGALTAPAAAGESDAAALGLQATVGFDGRTVHGAWTPVEVTIAPDRIFAGELRVIGNATVGSRPTERRRVEVAAGTTKVFRFVLPGVSSVRVEASADGRGERAVVQAQAAPTGRDTVLVGVLGGVPEGVPNVELVPSNRRVAFVGIDPAWLELSVRSLASLGTLVAGSDHLEGLSEEAREHLATAVTTGLDLTVLAPDPGPVDLAGARLPSPVTASDGASVTPASGAWVATPADLLGAGADATTPTGAGRLSADRPLAAAMPAGRGRVVVLASALGSDGSERDAALWSQVLSSGAQVQYLGNAEPALQRVSGVAQEALSATGLAVPSLPWLTGFMIAYVLIVGPLNGFVLSRLRRRDLAWVTVPAITVVFAIGAFVASSSSAPRTGLAGRVAYWIDGQGTELAVAAVRAPQEGVQTVRFPAGGWDVVTSSSNATVDRDGSDTSVAMDLQPLEVGTVLGWKASDQEAPLTVDAVIHADRIEVTVTNISGSPLSDVTVRSATELRTIGTLAQGAFETVEIDGTTLDTVPAWQDDLEELRDFDGHPRLPDALQALLRWEVMDRAPGLVWATAAADGALGGPIAATGDRGSEVVGTVVAVASQPGLPASGQVAPHAVQRTVAAIGGVQEGPEGGFWPSTTALESTSTVVLRYRLPSLPAPLVALTGSLERSSEHAPRVVKGFPGCPPDADCPAPPAAIEVIPDEELPCPPEPNTGCGSSGSTCEPGGGCFETNTEMTCDDTTCHLTVERCEDECVVLREETFPVGAPPPGPVQLRDFAVDVEVWDVVARSWIALDEAFPGDGDGRESADPDRVIGPFGEVHVRLVNDVRGLVEFSGRGIGFVLEGAS